MSVRDEPAPSGGVLAGGQFYSPTVRQERQAHLLLTELRQPTPRSLPRHEHELAYVTVVLEGGYSEGHLHGVTELHPFTAIFNPSGVTHTSGIGNTGSRLFTIECPTPLLDTLDLRLPPSPVVDRGTGDVLWPSLRIFSAFRRQDADPLVLECQALELLGALTGRKADNAAAPRWLRRVKDRLHARFQERTRVCDLAAEAGVHPVHLARTFRARVGRGVGDYVQRLRVRAACEQLRDRHASLAGVAADCGFADQSHLTRTFKRILGATPGGFRKALCSGDEGAAVWLGRPAD
jgi:AraC family transcriptional regulator